MKQLRIDEKWSIWYDPDNNDRPLYWQRYNDEMQEWEDNNAITALFYALLEKQ